MKLPPRHPMLYILTLIIIPIVFITIVEYTHAENPYSVAPRLSKNCIEKWIGTEYHPLPTCTKVWGQITREMLLEESDYFYNLESNAETLPKR